MACPKAARLMRRPSQRAATSFWKFANPGIKNERPRLPTSLCRAKPAGPNQHFHACEHPFHYFDAGRGHNGLFRLRNEGVDFPATAHLFLAAGGPVLGLFSEPLWQAPL